MELKFFYSFYKIGRFIFALTLLISLHMTGVISNIPSLLAILTTYVLVTFIRLVITNDRFFSMDFILDIILLSGILYLNLAPFTFLTLFYLVPIFLASILIKHRVLFLFPLFATLAYIVSIYASGSFFIRDNIINIILHSLSFFLMAMAGNAMRKKLDKQEIYIRKLEDEKIKMESYKRLYRVSTDLIHEIRNPLATISAATQFLKEGKNDPELIDMLSHETKKLTNLANDFLLYCRPEEAPREKVDIADVIKILIKHKSISKKIMFELQDNVLVLGNRTYLEAAIDNIIKNAIEAAHSSVIISVKKESGNVIINIEDDGEGIKDGMEERIFEPFFTTKQTGTGLGLAISNRIIGGFGGNIIINKSPIGGAMFTVVLPVAGEG